MATATGHHGIGGDLLDGRQTFERIDLAEAFWAARSVNASMAFTRAVVGGTTGKPSVQPRAV